MIDFYDVLFFFLIITTTLAIERSSFWMLIISIILSFVTFVVYPSYMNICDEENDDE